MKQWRISTGLLMLPFATVALLWSHGIGWAKRARAQSETFAKSAVQTQQLSAEGQASLRAIIQAGNLPDLRWPDFSDYDKHVQKFYESYEHSLPWITGMEPTAQAQQVIALLLKRTKRGCPLGITMGRVGPTGWRNSNPWRRNHQKEMRCDSISRSPFA